jgi:hypothetical protein
MQLARDPLTSSSLSLETSMKHLWIGLIVAGALAACRNGSNNARDTTGFGSGGTAGGSLPATSRDTTGMSTGGTATPPAPLTSDTTKRDTTQSAATKHHKKSHKRP